MAEKRLVVCCTVDALGIMDFELFMLLCFYVCVEIEVSSNSIFVG